MPNAMFTKPTTQTNTKRWKTRFILRTKLPYNHWRQAVIGAILRKVGPQATLSLVPTLPLIQHFREGLTPAEAATLCTGVSGHGLSEAERLSVQGKLHETKE